MKRRIKIFRFKEGPMYPASSRDTAPLPDETWDAVYEAGHRRALKAFAEGVPVDVDSLFLDEIRNGRSMPRDLNESSQQFWEYHGAFEDGVLAAGRS